MRVDLTFPGRLRIGTSGARAKRQSDHIEVVCSSLPGRPVFFSVERRKFVDTWIRLAIVALSHFGFQHGGDICTTEDHMIVCLTWQGVVGR